MLDGEVPMRLLLEYPHCLERTKRFGPAELNGLVAGGRIVHASRRDRGHIKVG
jgi:hypothetical protein